VGAAQAAPLQRTLGFPFCADLAPLKVDPADADMRAPRLSWNSGATVRGKCQWTVASAWHSSAGPLVACEMTLACMWPLRPWNWGEATLGTVLEVCPGFSNQSRDWKNASQVALAGVFTAAVDGHHLLISSTGETVRFTLAAGAQVRAEFAGSFGLPLQCSDPV
jgi:hypothetical protein